MDVAARSSNGSWDGIEAPGPRSSNCTRVITKVERGGHSPGMISRTSLVLSVCTLVTTLAPALACGRVVGLGSDEQETFQNGECGPGKTVCVDGGAAPTFDAADSAAMDRGRAPVGEGVVKCPFGMPLPGDPSPGMTKTYRRSCATKADCAIGLHVNDCCGTLIALGVETADKPRFDANGNICGNSFPVCACAAGRTVVDGEMSMFADHHDVDVRCVANACETYLPSFACGERTCDSRTQFCEAFQAGVALPDGGMPPTSYTCSPIPAACAATPDCACITAGTSGVTCAEPKGRVTVTRQGI